MPFKKKEEKTTYQREWRKKHPKESIQQQTRYVQKMRTFAIELLGGICCNCGFSDPRALQFDHIKGGGCMESKERTRNHYRIIIDSILNKENKYQLLCANCNWIKRSENNELKRKYE